MEKDVHKDDLKSLYDLVSMRAKGFEGLMNKAISEACEIKAKMVCESEPETETKAESEDSAEQEINL